MVIESKEEYSLCEEFERKCLDGALGDSEEVALVKRLVYCVECINYPLSGFRNNLLFSSVWKHVLSSQLSLRERRASSQIE